ncbi:hypothetical protein J6590_048459 [Homalodisca vitripennis]|nr:hypothetical protein J6590_048459 [Homalodisca vitripennis]
MVYIPPLLATLPELRARIYAAAEQVTPEMLVRDWEEIDYRWDCLVVLTEHGLKSDSIMCAQLANYTLVSVFGRERHLKGCVAIYKRSELPTEVLSLDIESLSTEVICEVSPVKITLDKRENQVVGR